MDRAERYAKLASVLLAAPDPVVAVAHELGDQAGRIDALARRLSHVEAALTASQTVRPPA